MKSTKLLMKVYFSVAKTEQSVTECVNVLPFSCQRDGEKDKWVYSLMSKIRSTMDVCVVTGQLCCASLSLHKFTFTHLLLWIFPSAWHRGSLTRMALAEGTMRWWPGVRSPASSSKIDSSAKQARRLCTFLQARRWVHTQRRLSLMNSSF